MTDRPTPASDEKLVDQWGEPLADIEKRYDRKLDSLERHIVLNVHSHSSCATGIWIESELSDMKDMVAAAVQAESRKLLDELIATAKMTGTLTVEDLTLIRDRHFTLLDSEQQKLGGKP